MSIRVEEQMSTDIDFRCARCSKCCKNLKIPLSVDEAVHWLSDGNPVQVLCEAIPWLEDLSASNQYAAFKRDRSFAAMSGKLPIRVLVTLAAPQGERCPNLVADNFCSIYERRPLVCRIYPAEGTPFLKLAPEQRHCPPEAWQAGGRSLMRNAVYTDNELRLHIRTRLNQGIWDVPSQEALCGALGINAVAMVNEGYVAHSPDNAMLLAALLETLEQPLPLAQDWKFVSNRTATVEAIRSSSAHCFFASEYRSETSEYISLYAK